MTKKDEIENIITGVIATLLIITIGGLFVGTAETTILLIIPIVVLGGMLIKSFQ